MQTFDVRQKTLVLWAVCDESLESSSNHGVFAHQYHGFASKVLSDFVHLLRRDIVHADLVKLLGHRVHEFAGEGRTMKIDLYSSSKPLSLSK